MRFQSRGDGVRPPGSPDRECVLVGRSMTGPRSAASDDRARHLMMQAVGMQQPPCSTMPRFLPSGPSWCRCLTTTESSFSLAAHPLGARMLHMDIGLAAGDSRGGGWVDHCQVADWFSRNRRARAEPAARFECGRYCNRSAAPCQLGWAMLGDPGLGRSTWFWRHFLRFIHRSQPPERAPPATVRRCDVFRY